MKGKTYLRILAVALALLLALAMPALADVMKGDRGDSVREVQRKLIDLGYLTGSADGIFGGGTERAVIEFQKAEGLTPTGVVNGETYQRLTNPTAHAPFFHKAKLEFAAMFQDNESGKNQNGRDVGWLFNIVVLRESWMDDAVEIKATPSWTNNYVNASNDSSWMPAWNNAKKGVTSYQSDEIAGYWWDNSGKEYRAFYYTVFLPDDPSIAGRRYMELEAQGDKAIVYFNLEYKGDYTNGTGWKLTNTAFEDMTSGSVTAPAQSSAQETPVAEQSNGVLSPEKALEKMEVYGGCGWINEPTEPEYAVGHNSNNAEVTYGISIYSNMAPAAFMLQSLSWTKDIQWNPSFLGGWDDAKRGKTSVNDNMYWNETQSDGSIDSGASIDIYLPDDPSLAGEQWLTVTCENYRALVRVQLTYNGNYQTGRGWTVKPTSITVNKIG